MHFIFINFFFFQRVVLSHRNANIPNNNQFSNQFNRNLNNFVKPQFVNTPMQRYYQVKAQLNMQNNDILPENQNNHMNQSLRYPNAVNLQPNINTNNPYLKRNSSMPQTGSHVSEFTPCQPNNASFDKQPQLNQLFISKLPYTRQQLYSEPYRPNNLAQTNFSTQNANQPNQAQNRPNQPPIHNSMQNTNQSTSSQISNRSGHANQSKQSISNRPIHISDRPVNNLQQSSFSNQHINQSSVSNSISNKNNNEFNKKTFNQNNQNKISDKNFSQILDLSKKFYTNT